jgi:hypothetical protein
MNQHATSAVELLRSAYAAGRDVAYLDGDLEAVGHGHRVVRGRHHEKGDFGRKVA